MSSNGEPKTEATLEEVAEGQPIKLASAYDFRSDTITTPTPSMLRSILDIPIHGDDVYSEDPATNSLEEFIMKLTGKPAAAFVLSGTMGNQLAVRSHLVAPPHSVVLDRRCHIFNYEAGGAAVLSQAHIIPVTPTNGKYLTLEDVKKEAVVSDDIHYCPTRLICLENSLNGTILPLEELRKISAFAKENSIKLHCDGARLWNVVAAGGGELEEVCGLFDSVSLCFSKGLGAPMGSILVGEKDFIRKVRHFRKMMGGGTRQSGIATAPARVAVEEIFLGGQLTRSHELAKRLEKTWVDLGGKLKFGCDTNMVWLDLDSLGVDGKDIPVEAEKVGIRWEWERIVVHHQISDDAIARLEGVMRKIVDLARNKNISNNDTNGDSNQGQMYGKTGNK